MLKSTHLLNSIEPTEPTTKFFYEVSCVTFIFVSKKRIKIKIKCKFRVQHFKIDS